MIRYLARKVDFRDMVQFLKETVYLPESDVRDPSTQKREKKRKGRRVDANTRGQGSKTEAHTSCLDKDSRLSKTAHVNAQFVVTMWCG